MSVFPSVSFQQTSETELLTSLINYASAHNLPFALWRLPDSPVKHLIISGDTVKMPRETALEELQSGFVFSPYNRSRETIFLPADYLFTFEQGKLKESAEVTTKSTALLENVLKQDKSRSFSFRNEIPSQNQQDDADFIGLVNSAIDQIEKGQFEKVVPSRKKVIDLPQSFDLITAFEKLCRRYHHAMVSVVNVPEEGTWLGTSPEVLISVQDQSIFRTVALAGTKQYTKGMNLKSVAWTQKEIEEQALVERYIISCFKKIRLREYEEHGPKTVVAGNLIHLKSDFEVDMKATNFPQLGSTMLQLLHPTSAVCGMPLEPALNFLSTHEKHDRKFYSGYLGPVNIQNNIDIFVNLRCMEIFEKKAVLYAGAGVTIDSIPEEEFDETELKFNTLLNVIL